MLLGAISFVSSETKFRIDGIQLSHLSITRYLGHDTGCGNRQTLGIARYNGFRGHRKPVYRWPNELPIAGEPPDTAAEVEGGAVLFTELDVTEHALLLLGGHERSHRGRGIERIAGHEGGFALLAEALGEIVEDLLLYEQA